jgi:CRISPR type IV-associated protein Csf2
MKNCIDVVLRTTSPWHVAYPDNESKTLKGLSLTQSKKVCQKSVPCFLANGLRGRLRRSIAKRILDVMTDVQGPIPAPVYVGMQTGSSSAQPDKTHLSVEELLRSQKHVYMGLFGGGSRTLPSKYKISDVNPILAHTVEAGLFNLPDDYMRTVLDSQLIERNEDSYPLQPYQLLEKRAFFKVDDIARGVNLDCIVKAVEGAEDGIAQYIESNSDSDKKRKGDETGDTKKTTVANMLSIECISTGTLMHFRVDVDPNLTSAQMGAVLLGLKDIFDTNYLGGWGRIDFGKFEVLSLMLNLDTFDVNETLEDGLYIDEDFSFEGASDAVRSFIDESETEIAAVQKDEMISYFTNLA